MFPVINIGPAAIQAAGLILLLSFMIGTWLTDRFSQKIGTHDEAIDNAILIGLVSGILGARLGFMMQNPGVFLDNPLSVLSLTPSMLDTSFGVLVGVLSAFIFAQKKHLPLWPTLDTLSPLVVLLFIGIHLANFANGNAFGLPTELPWAVQLWNAMRHPVQLYTIILAALFLTWMLIHTKMLSVSGFMHSGLLFTITVVGLSVITVFTRAFVAEKILLAGVDIVQIIGFFAAAGGLRLIYSRRYSIQKRVPVLISMGANIEPEKNLSKAVDEIKSQFRLRRDSSTYQTEPVDQGPKGKSFLNKVIEIETDLGYPALVNQLKSIEKKFGRVPGNKRQVPLDLDVLVYDGQVFSVTGKRIPDPNLIKYAYIARPLAEMAPDFRHPANGKSIESILEQLDDNSRVIKIEEVENGT